MSDDFFAAESAGHASPFEAIRRTNDAGNEFWSSRDFARVLGYADYRNFERVVEDARIACFNSGQRVEDHFVDVTEMIEVGKTAQRPVKTVLMWGRRGPSRATEQPFGFACIFSLHFQALAYTAAVA